MKNLSLILNGVLAVAVGVLYYFHFACSGCATAPVAKANGNDTLVVVEEEISGDSVTAYLPDSLPAAGNIAYINLEQLTEKYQFYKDGIKALEKEATVKQNQLLQQQEKWQAEVQRFQQQAATMTEEAGAAKQEQLRADQERLYALRDELEGSLSEKNAVFTKQFLTKLDGYFKGLAKEKNYDYVFVYSKGSPAMIVYANEKLNITNYTLQGLNSQYKKK